MGQTRFRKGVVSKPPIAFRNDPDTGIGSLAANQLDGIAGGVSLLQVKDSGMTLGAGATSKTDNVGGIYKTVFTLTDEPIVFADDAGVGQYGGVKLADMPAGNNIFLGAVLALDIELTELAWVDAAEGDIGLGTALVTDGDALAGTEQNIVPTTAIPAMTSQAGSCNAGSSAVAVVQAAGTTDTDLYLNVRIDDDAAHAAGNGVLNGTVTLLWANLGDY